MEEKNRIEELLKRIEELEAKVEKLMAAVFPKPDRSHFNERGGR
jgi:hypothetical protein